MKKDAAAAARRTQAERREEAEAKLLNAAVELIARHGMEGFRMADVGEAAGYSRGLPVHYFGSKEKLLIRVSHYVVELYYASLARHPEAPRGLPRLQQIVRQYCGLPMTNAVRALTILVVHAQVMPGLLRAIQRLHANGLRSLEAELAAGVESGTVRPDTNCAQVSRLMYSFLRGQMQLRLLDPEHDGSAVAEEFLSMLELKLQPPAKAKATSRAKPQAKQSATPRPKTAGRSRSARA